MDLQSLSKGEKTRRALIASAQELFAKNGYEATGVDAIVASIDLTSGVFYANFKSKEALLKEVLRVQIEASRKFLLVERQGETTESWLRRVITFYLSAQNRDRLELSCPMTTMSQELLKLNLFDKIGLAQYLKDFEKILSQKLEFIHDGWGAKAQMIIATCVGGLQTARLFQDKNESNAFLFLLRESLFSFIFVRSSTFLEKTM
jgi:TetR/AcrR family transcriptional regulator, transcriptional repressor for nem operon